jgi:diguanylate cyclase (GGDEF)-like protein/PAS domain S-box-containing protein
MHAARPLALPSPIKCPHRASDIESVPSKRDTNRPLHRSSSIMSMFSAKENATLTAQLHDHQSQLATLRTAEEKFRMIFVNATVGIFQTSPEGHYLACNPALAKIYGYDSPEELQAAVTQISDQLYVEDGMRAKFAALIAKDGRVTAFEARIFRKDRHIIWISETAREVRDPDGKLLYYEGFVTDITAQKTAEESLRESEERYALSIRGAKDGVWDWNLRTGRIHFSARWKEMLGHREDEINTFPQEWFDRVHPDDREAVQSAVAAHLEGSTPHLEIEHRMLHVDGAYRWMLSRGLAIRGENGKVTRMAGSQTDVTQRREAEEQLLRDALHDSLTGLPNRVLMADRIDRSIARITRDPDHKFAVLFLDLDRFKVINDSLGHAAGDQLLVAFARRLTADLRAGDTAARLVGDEFTILLEDPAEPHGAMAISKRILEALKEPFLLGSNEVFVSASIGIAESSANYSRPQDVLRDADTAMYRAKARGKSCVEVFDAAMHARAVKLLQVENDLRRALVRNEFEIHYQPIVRIDTGRVRAFEALIRWNHPERGLVMPGEFISIAEETGLILPIGNWVLREACRQTAQWNALAPDAPVDINVNLSGRQFSQNDLVDQVKDALRHSGLSATHLILEITESVVMEHPEATIAMLHRLKALGLKLNIDDFGTGYSSLAYLQRFPVDTMKIDRSFISCMSENHENAEIVKTIVHLAHSLDMKVTAEGIEHPEQLAQLQALHCENAQGFLLSKPLSATAATTLLLTRDTPLAETTIP